VLYTTFVSEHYKASICGSDPYHPKLLPILRKLCQLKKKSSEQIIFISGNFGKNYVRIKMLPPVTYYGAATFGLADWFGVLHIC
jgi:hypothetical protein